MRSGLTSRRPTETILLRRLEYDNETLDMNVDVDVDARTYGLESTFSSLFTTSYLLCSNLGLYLTYFLDRLGLL